MNQIKHRFGRALAQGSLVASVGLCLASMGGLQENGDPDPVTCYESYQECMSQGDNGFCTKGTLKWCDGGYRLASSGYSATGNPQVVDRKCVTYTAVSDTDVTRTSCDLDPPSGYARGGCSNSSGQCCDYSLSRSTTSSTDGSITIPGTMTSGCVSTLIPFGD